MERVELIMLGTGHATVTRCYNTCFVLKIRESAFLVDGGGGNGILHQLEKAGISLTDLSGIFITHVHIDHILGCCMGITNDRRNFFGRKLYREIQCIWS